jgi:hypothetical protein
MHECMFYDTQKETSSMQKQHLDHNINVNGPDANIMTNWMVVLQTQNM